MMMKMMMLKMMMMLMITVMLMMTMIIMVLLSVLMNVRSLVMPHGNTTTLAVVLSWATVDADRNGLDDTISCSFSIRCSPKL